MHDLEILDATAQAQLLRRRELTAVELVEAAIERVERLNPEVNAIVTPMYERALQQARGELPQGVLSGVPYVLKDLHAEVAGVRYTEGSKFLADVVSEHDQELVLRHRRAGLIAIGKSSTPEFGILPTTEPELFGPTRVVGSAQVRAGRGVEQGRAVSDAPRQPVLDSEARQPVRIGVTTAAVTGVPVDPECVRAVEETALLCEELGHDVFPFTPSDLDGDEMSAAFIVLYTTGVAASIESWSRRLGRAAAAEHFEPLTWAMREAALNYRASGYMLALGQLQLVSRRIASYYAGFDVWLMPVMAEPPPPLGSFAGSPDNPMFPLLRAAMYVPFTPIANITGQPAMSVPLSWTEAGLPVGSHFIGRYADEATLFRLASQLEEARPWAGRRPALTFESVS